MKLIIFGAGYVGSALLKDLQTRDYQIYITTTQEKRVDELKSLGKEVFIINDKTDFRDLILPCDGMIVLVAPGQLKSYEETYLNTAQKIASTLKDRKKPFFLLYTSSTSVCEGVQEDWITEGTPLNPISENGKILLKTEQIYLESGVEACILRLGGIYGPNRTLLDRAKRFSGKIMNSSGDEPTNHIHLDDILRAILFCLDHTLKGVYHLVNDDHRTRKVLYTSLCQIAHLQPPIWSSMTSHKGYKVSNSKIKKAGFSFAHPMLQIGKD